MDTNGEQSVELPHVLLGPRETEARPDLDVAAVQRLFGSNAHESRVGGVQPLELQMNLFALI